MTIPPEPRLVRWYFEHRSLASPGDGYSAHQIAFNDRLWRAVCNEGIEGGQSFLDSASRGEQDAVVNTAATALQAVLTDPHTDRHGAGYMREYMRKKRAAQRPP